MGVSLQKVQAEAPHLVSLVKATTVSLRKNGIDADQNKAAVVATIDDSGSAEHLFKSGEIQRVADLAFAAGLVFDDDGEMPASFFNNRVQDLGSINLGNCKDFIARQRPQWGGTQYASALRWIIDQAGYGRVNLSNGGGGGFFNRGGSQLSVKATAQYPTFAIFITDGQPQDGREAADLLTAMSQLPIFVQFVGVGPASFPFLEGLNDLKGRYIDNAGFFDAKKAQNTSQMLEGLLNEFPQYYREARAKGLVA